MNALVRPPRHPIYHWRDLDGIPPADWIIKRIFGRAGFSILYGPSGSMKTFAAIDIAAHIAEGKPWCGRKVKAGAVLYIAAEGGIGIVPRFKAYAQHHELDRDAIPLHILPQPVNLRDPHADIPFLLEAIGGLKLEFVFIVVDTFSRALAGGDENAPGDVGTAILNCDRLRQELRAHVMLVHHTGKDPGRGTRGHSSLPAAVDTSIACRKYGAGTTLTVEKQRDAVGGEKFTFRARTVDLGIDDDGEPVTSMVLEPSEVPGAVGQGSSATAPPLTKATAGALQAALTKATAVALQAAKDVMGSQPVEASGTVKALGVEKVISVEAWKNQAFNAGICPKGSEDGRRMAFQRAKKDLVNQGLIGIEGDFAWLISDTQPPEG